MASRATVNLSRLCPNETHTKQASSITDGTSLFRHGTLWISSPDECGCGFSEMWTFADWAQLQQYFAISRFPDVCVCRKRVSITFSV